MSGPILRNVLRAAKHGGGFSAARRATANTLRILCYHGFSIDDEHRHFPGMFVSEDTLRRRMQVLADGGYRVVSLGEGVRRLLDGTLEPDTVVITIDDGFYSTLTVAAPVFREFGVESTLYLTTWYMERQTPIYSFLFVNMLLRSARPRVDLSDLGPKLPERLEIAGRDAHDPVWKETARQIDETHPLEARDAVYAEIGGRLGVDYEKLRDRRMYHLVSRDEVPALEDFGVDIQLHTHRHKLPEDPAGIRDEVERNREILGDLCGSDLRHLCYPSGLWCDAHLPVLEELGIASATTTDIGENLPGTHPLKLYRFLDRDDFSDLEFEAEVSGFKPLLRRGARLAKRARA